MSTVLVGNFIYDLPFFMRKYDTLNTIFSVFQCIDLQILEIALVCILLCVNFFDSEKKNRSKFVVGIVVVGIVDLSQVKAS